MTKETGRQAFPDLIKGKDNYQLEGWMSLRDWFAGQALTGLLSTGKGVFVNDVQTSDPKAMAMFAYQYADAMLTARKDSDESKAE